MSMFEPNSIRFTVLGPAQPQGSTRAFMIAGRPRITSSNKKLKPWRQEVGQMALEARDTEHVWAGKHEPVSITVDFYFAQPKSAKKRALPTVKPDLDKTVRGLADSLTGILFHDDSQVVAVSARKLYGLPERSEIEVTKL